MAVWYARQTANINAANVWNAAQDGSGAWLTWPPASGDVLMSNGYTLTINVDFSLGAAGELRNDTFGSATAGGQFNVATSRTIVANVYAGAAGSRCVLVSSGTVSWSGHSYGGTAANISGIVQSGGTLTFTGNGYGGSATNAAGVYCAGGSMTVVGNAYGGSGAAAGFLTAATPTALTLTGNAYGGIGSAGVQHSASTTFNHTGNAIGSSTNNFAGFQINAAATTVNITGNAIADVGIGATNTSTGTLNISGYAQASNAASGVNNTAQGVLQVGETRSASNGRGAVTGAFRFASATTAKSMPYTASEDQISLTVLDVAATVPATDKVRKSVVYGDGGYTGTLDLGRRNTSMAGRF